MIDWLWVFNAVIAILQSYESKVFNIFTIDDGQKLVSFHPDSRSPRLYTSNSLLLLLFKHWDFKSRLPEKSVVHWLIERKAIYGDMQDNYVDKHLS